MTTSLMAVAIDHHHGFKPLGWAQRCKLPSFAHLESAAMELDRTNRIPSFKMAMASARFHRRSLSTPCLSASTKADDEFSSGPRVEIVAGHSGQNVRSLVVEAAIALASGVDLVPARDGLGGAYFLHSRTGESIAVVKPIDEEPLAMKNPKGGIAGWILGQTSLRRSVQASETGIREVAAYLLDHDGFAGVPPTALVKILHVAFHVDRSRSSAAIAPQPSVKIASIQRFVANDFNAGDLGPSSFSITSVHHIGILDIRLFNIDRHAGNILVRKCAHGGYASCANHRCESGAAELVPIDHGLCLPESLDDPYFEWLHWPQASVPFAELELNYISRLDPLKDAELLRSELPSLSESSLRILVLCTIFLKCAASAGLCLADIGDMMTREFHGMEEEPSMLERLCKAAMVRMNTAFNNDSDEQGSTEEKKEEEKQEAIEQFQFDMDCKDICPADKVSNNSLDHPLLKMPLRYPSAKLVGGFSIDDTLSPLDEEDDDHNDNSEDDDGMGSATDRKFLGLTKSVSFVVMEHNHEWGEISFRAMGKEEWELFLGKFEELLPKAFESRKSMRLKLRLGTSCRF
ncbi:phosphatidylinositol 4-kinase gamma 8 [Magnolia sinica]|uniref:phosphatidylinositol 4-kinase gamma 8 n=1 Tax=Magnolia sinica TaxID=86752 RepID=UPI002657C7C7|nr:phosphatidylinositol 4-kinase gamma 8 [Magnolia sinica]XP_058112370.1 phosphatidylinositol 4-kinase gamma 8 [Magnolia sinica]XP_058112371.1 phosphatidylinositol 4-kinase gamma 8 [Magnolia sinica]